MGCAWLAEQQQLPLCQRSGEQRSEPAVGSAVSPSPWCQHLLSSFFAFFRASAPHRSLAPYLLWRTSVKLLPPMCEHVVICSFPNLFGSVLDPRLTVSFNLQTLTQQIVPTVWIVMSVSTCWLVHFWNWTPSHPDSLWRLQRFDCCVVLINSFRCSNFSLYAHPHWLHPSTSAQITAALFFDIFIVISSQNCRVQIGANTRVVTHPLCNPPVATFNLMLIKR